jgi:hypothetical protein
MVEELCSASTGAEHYGQAQTCGTVGWGIIVPNIGIVIYYFNQEFCGMYIGSFHYGMYFIVHLDFSQLLSCVVCAWIFPPVQRTLLPEKYRVRHPIFSTACSLLCLLIPDFVMDFY